jgi:shikimate dehydrogenase
MGQIFQLGLIGNPVAHSQSPKIFQKFFDNENLPNWNYNLFQLTHIDELPGLLNSYPNLVGFNVTVPFKQAIIPYLNSISDAAKAMNAVNTVKVFRKNGDFFLEGHNTDYYGFLETANRLPSKPVKAVILGNGGSANAVKAVLNFLKVPFNVVSRNPKNDQISYGGLLDLTFHEPTLIIQTTPVGMHPNIDVSPIFPFQHLNENVMAIDLIYNPKETLFLKQFKNQGCFCLNGSLMLQKQAEMAWTIFKNNEKS